MTDPDAFNAFEAAGWEQHAGGYDRFFGAITTGPIDALLDAAAVGPDTRVLDVATGPGYVAARAAARGARVVGVDVAAAMLAMAHELHPGLELREADAHALPFGDESFDAVVGNFVVLHLGRPEQAAGQLARVLAPGGRVALTTWDVPERCAWLGVMLGAVSEAGATPPEDVPAGPDFFRFADDDEFDALLAAQGFEDRNVETIEFTRSFASPDELWEGLMGGTVRTSALVAGQPEETQQAIRVGFDRRVAEYRSAEGFELPVSVKLASGRKPG